MGVLPSSPWLHFQNEGVSLEWVKTQPCRPVEFKKQSCRPVEFKKQPCRMSLRPKKGRVAVSILGVHTPRPVPLPGQRHGNFTVFELHRGCLCLKRTAFKSPPIQLTNSIKQASVFSSYALKIILFTQLVVKLTAYRARPLLNVPDVHDPVTYLGDLLAYHYRHAGVRLKLQVRKSSKFDKILRLRTCNSSNVSRRYCDRQER